jgi:glyoxylase I family protein
MAHEYRSTRSLHTAASLRHAEVGSFLPRRAGFEVVQTAEREGDQFDWGLLRLNDTQVMLNTAYEQEFRPAQPDSARIAAHRDTCLYFSCPDVDGAHSHLRAQGI